ncbi:hypothetical protein D3C78_1984140 [compost metagenome]
MNGMLLEELQDIPEIGTRVQISNYDIDILDVQDNMIKQVRVTPNESLKTSIGHE